MQWVEREPALRVTDGSLQGALSGQRARQPFECVGGLATQCVRFEQLPVIKRRTVAQREASREVTAIQLTRLRERSDARWARLGSLMPVRTCFGQSGAEQFDVDPYLRPARLQADFLAVDVEPLATQTFLECRKGPAQAGAGALLVVLGPQQCCQGVSPVCLAGDGEVHEQGDRFASVNLDGF